MAALTFLACNVVGQIWDLSTVYISSGFSIKKCVYHLRNKRNNQLFCKYCQELWLESNRERNNLTTRNVLSSINDDTKLVNNFSYPIHGDLKKDNSTGLQQSLATNVRRKFNGKMSVDLETDFTPVDTFANETNTVSEDPIACLFGDIEIITGQEISSLSTFNDYLETVPVYQDDSLGDIHEGVSFSVTGLILPNCERFSINLIIATQTRDVALHINPRLPQNYIVRNTKVKGIWGREEVSSALPFCLHRGATFSIQILITDACFMISVNGNHFAEYKHRVPYKLLSCLEVKGDVDNITHSRSVVAEYPDRHPESQEKSVKVVKVENTSNNELTKIGTEIKTQSIDLNLPYYGLLPAKGFGPGKNIKIQGRVKILPHSFYINLQCGQNIWPHPTIAFHFNPRFARRTGGLGRHVVCRNSWQGGYWDKEEASEITTDFCPGKPFCMEIACGAEDFEVYVNGKQITKFRFRLQPEIVDTIYIQGDIKIWSVTLQSKLTTKIIK